MTVQLMSDIGYSHACLHIVEGTLSSFVTAFFSSLSRLASPADFLSQVVANGYA